MVVWWHNYGWMVKFFSAMIAGSMLISLVFAGIATLPILVFELIIP